MNDQEIVNVKAIRGWANKWSIDAFGRMVVEEIKTNKLCVGETCVDESMLKKILEKAGVVAPTEESPRPSLRPGREPAGSESADSPAPEVPPALEVIPVTVSDTPIEVPATEPSATPEVPAIEPAPEQAPAVIETPVPELTPEPTQVVAETPAQEPVPIIEPALAVPEVAQL